MVRERSPVVPRLRPPLILPGLRRNRYHCSERQLRGFGDGSRLSCRRSRLSDIEHDGHGTAAARAEAGHVSGPVVTSQQHAVTTQVLADTS
eukprot:1601784-Rhodomonas_salina.1